MKYFIEIKDNKKFIKILNYFEKKFVSIEVFISFVRISFYNDEDEEEEYVDLDRKYFNIIESFNIERFSVIRLDLLNLLKNFDIQNRWVLFQDDENKIIISDSKKGFFIL